MGIDTLTTSLALSPASLPNPTSSFVGREVELVQGKQLLRSCRALSLVGMGGVGKTRLAIELARRVQDHFSRVFFVDLAQTRDLSEALAAIAGVVAPSDTRREPSLTVLQERLSTGQALLILDTCEHLVEACGEIIAELLDRCPRLKIMATSRKSLDVAGALSWHVRPLDLPETDGPQPPRNWAQSDAVRLFVKRVREANPSFQLAASNAAQIVEICEQLSGLPLALELAAACARELSLADIAGHLGDHLQLLRHRVQTGAARHQSMRAALDWSYDLLQPDERVAFQRLSTFQGGFTLEAVGAILGEGQTDAAKVSELLTRLVEHSLVLPPANDRENRYQILETVRQYAAERLCESGTSDDVAERHARWFLAFAQRAGQNVFGPEQGVWLDAIEKDLGNVRVAYHWFATRGDVDARLVLTGSIYRYWATRGRLAEGFTLIQEALQDGDKADPTALVIGLRGACVLARELGNVSVAIALAEESCRVAREPREVAWALANLGVLTGEENGGQLLRQAAARFEAADDECGHGWALGYLGLSVSDIDESDRLTRECLARMRRCGDQFGIAWACGQLVLLKVSLGTAGEASGLLEEAFAITDALRAKYLQAALLTVLVRLLRYATQPDGDPNGVVGESLVPSWRIFEYRLGDRAAGETIDQRLSAAEDEVLRLRHLNDDPVGIAYSAVLVGLRYAKRGEFVQAVPLLAVGDRLYQVYQRLRGRHVIPAAFRRFWPAFQLFEPAIEAARRSLGDARFDTLWREGGASPWPDPDALELTARQLAGASGLAETGQPVAIPPPAPRVEKARLASPVPARRGASPRLTDREQDVLRRVARGQTNGSIARDLALSDRTVERHLANIYLKLGCHDRATAVAVAVETGIL